MTSASICIVQKSIHNGLQYEKTSTKLIRFLYNLGITTDKIVTITNNNIKHELRCSITSSDILLISCNFTQEVFNSIAQSFNIPVCDAEKSIRQVRLPYEKIGPSSPIIKVRNVYIIPQSITSVQLRNSQKYFLFLSRNLVFFNRFVHVKFEESIVLKVLEDFHKAYGVVRSYCRSNDDQLVNVTLESKDLEVLIKCEKQFRKILAQLKVLTTVCCSIQPVFEMMGRNKIIAEAVDVLEKCFSKYRVDEVFISFNGGKDCTVLLYLTIAVLKKLYPMNSQPQIQCLYIQSSDPFEELNSFVTETIQDYNLQVTTISGSIRSALDRVLQTEPKYKATLMGTRKTDPHADTLEHFKITDKGWPQVMRVNPILNWSYHDVWEFLKELEIPYCCLYDMGYTSIGNTTNTTPNPALRTDRGYLPAYLLQEGALERDGRGTDI